MRTRRLRDISLHGWLAIGRWTVLGTLGCMTVSVAFNWMAFQGHAPESFRQGIVSAVTINALLAAPLFFYLNVKLRELSVVNHKLNHLATTDALTGILNRSAFSNAVECWLERARHAGRGTGALLVIDADRFKAINDRYGHECGDEALRRIAGALASTLRGEDIVGRLGGEEFGVFLPGVTNKQAEQVGERLREAVAGIAFQPSGSDHRLSVSIGCAAFDRPAPYDELFRNADTLLYDAKREGRDRVICADVPSVWDLPEPISATPGPADSVATNV
jgi:diguanylate cyclase